MSRKPSETVDADAAADAREDKRARGDYWRRLRRRLFGAAAMLLLIGMLWQLGDDSRPPRVQPAAPSVEPFAEVTPPPSLQTTVDELAQLKEIQEFAPEEEDENIRDNVAANFNADSGADIAASEQSAADFADGGDVSADAETAETAPVPKTDSARIAEIESESSLSSESDAAADADGDSLFADVADVPGFAVQIGAFQDKKRAVRLARKLQKENIAVKIFMWEQEGALLWRVRAVGFATRAAAEVTRKDLIARGYNPNASVRDQD